MFRILPLPFRNRKPPQLAWAYKVAEEFLPVRTLSTGCYVATGTSSGKCLSSDVTGCRAT